MSYVYVIALGGDDGPFERPVKIGVTDDPEARLKYIRPASPFGVSYAFLHEVPDRGAAFALERSVHKSLRDSRLDYEWFNVDPEVAIKAIKANR